ncbi:SNF2 helicase associated domain-containing protein [Niallia sp. 03091]|uniref:SNF2 helicase associated domain-containing protein n=1 Tax=unclassified Niallia TaxID=2837522 RepID=UPI00404506FD
MNIKLNQKIIKELCGTVSFKRGDSFYQNNKVEFTEYQANGCKAIVKGGDDFYITIKTDGDGGMQSECSCPKLASFDRECQHIAAVLLAVLEHERNGTVPIIHQHPLTEGLLQLFDEKPIRSSGHQSHFENREVLEVDFTCRLIGKEKEPQLLGIDIKIGSTKVMNISSFLSHIKEGKPYKLSPGFTFDQQLHCFPAEIDAVIGQLVSMREDEKLFIDKMKEIEGISSEIFLLPPSSFDRLVPSLKNLPNVTVEYGGCRYAGFHVSIERLPLTFEFVETAGKNYRLNISGFHKIIILPAYQSVFTEGKLTQLENQDCQRLVHLQEMLYKAGTNSIPFEKKQVDFFLEKVAPGLKKLGAVEVGSAAAKQFQTDQLIAKLYLDRVNNRLLAALEFHYGHIVLNPLEKKEVLENGFLLRDVEKEMEILKLMENSSFSKTDSGYILQNEGLEYAFLYHTLPTLKKIVQVYATTAVRNRIFRENAKPMIKVSIKKERTNWLEFKFNMDFPEKEIRDILTALEEKRKYYRLRNGSLLSLETREMEEIQRFLQSPQIQQEDLINGVDLSIHQSFPLAAFLEENHLLEKTESFREFAAILQKPGSMNFDVPKNIEPILKDYQKIGFNWMKTLAYYGFGGILADDMGLGKTLQSIAFILSELKTIRRENLPALIVCPSSLTYNWLNEWMKFAPETQVVVMDGNKTERMKLQKDLREIDVVITSYPLLRKDSTWFEKQNFHSVIFDEAQYFKNPFTQTAKTVKKIKADYRFALTGTPVENASEELWSIFHVVFPSLFSGLKEYSHLTRKNIAKRIRPFMLRRLKEDVLTELPEKIEWQESTDMLLEQKKLYGAYLAKLRHDTLKHLDKDTLRKNKIRILAGLTRLRQICCHPRLFVDGYQGSSAKFEQLMTMVEEAKQSKRRVLIFSQFTKMLELIGRELAIREVRFFYLDGRTPSEERVELCRRFNIGECDFFLISLKAGGTGLNLMTADTVILYDSWWNPAVEEQAADRAHRIGQKNTVQVIKLVARGTIEEKINELQEKKRHLINEIIDSEEQLLSTLTEADVKDLLGID